MTRFNNRARGIRDEKKRIIIICEGKVTEPTYFRILAKDKRVQTVETFGTGFNTISLVEYAIGLIEEIEKEPNKKLREDDEVWVVFDEDNFKNGDFDNAIDKIKINSYCTSHNFKVAYSNECFEKWFLLHLKCSTSASGRKSYYKDLKKLIGKSYTKNSGSLLSVYACIKENIDMAIKNAEILEKYWDDQGQDVPSKQKPITKVHHLVKSIIEQGD